MPDSLNDLPVACLLFEEGRFQPILVDGTGSVGDATFIDVRDPGGIAADVDVGLGHIPLVTLVGEPRAKVNID